MTIWAAIRAASQVLDRPEEKAMCKRSMPRSIKLRNRSAVSSGFAAEVVGRAPARSLS